MLLLLTALIPCQCIEFPTPVREGDEPSTGIVDRKGFGDVLVEFSSRYAQIASFNNIAVSQQPSQCPEDLAEIAYADLTYLIKHPHMYYILQFSGLGPVPEFAGPIRARLCGLEELHKTSK